MVVMAVLLDAKQIQRWTDLVALINGYIRLRRSGRQFVGLCPLHQERHPSFYVHPEKQVFYCFGCGAGGDVFDFVMGVEHCGFLRALDILHRRFLGGATEARRSLPGRGSEGAKPPKPAKQAPFHSPDQPSRRAVIVQSLDETERYLRAREALLRSAWAELETGCEPRGEGAPFLLERKS